MFNFSRFSEAGIRRAAAGGESNGFRHAALPRSVLKLGWVLLMLIGSATLPSRGADPSGAPPNTQTPDWKALFDGKTLRGWKVTDFAGHGEVNVVPSFRAGSNTNAAPAILLEMGAVMTGITWTNPPPEGDFELALEAMKLEGSDFFCALTFPAGNGHCSLVVGGWGGGVVGISSLDGMDASENETTKFMSFEKNRWYTIRVRVRAEKLEAWVDEEKVVNVSTKDRRISVRAGEIELAQPLGISAFQTKSALRQIRLRTL